MAQPIIQPSFSAGEFSPTLSARVDLAKYKIGAALMYNMFVDYRGGTSNRMGTAFVGRCKDSTSDVVLIPWQYSTALAYVLEIGNQYIRFVKNGAYVTEAAVNITAVTQANPGVVTANAHGYSNGDWVYISSVLGMTRLNTNTYIVAGATTNTFQLHDLNGNLVNTTGYSAYISGGTVARIYTLVAPWLASENLPLIRYAQSSSEMTLTRNSYSPYELVRISNASWTLTPSNFQPVMSAPANLAAIGSAGSGAATYTYVVTAVDVHGNESLGQTFPLAITTIDMATSTSGNVTVSWSPVTGADYYNVYKGNPIRGAVGGSGIIAGTIPPGTTYGFMTRTTGLATVDSNILPDFSKTVPIQYDPFTPGQLDHVTLTVGGSGYTSEPTVTVTGGGGGTGAVVRAQVYNGAVTGLVIITPGYGYTSNPSLVFSGGGGTLAAGTATIGAIVGTYPAIVSYYQQRRVFAATDNEPEAFWMSQPGLFTDYNISDPSRDDDSITATLVSAQVNAIKHMVPMPGGLIILTSYGAWQVSGGGGANSPVTPANIAAQAQAYNGASDVTPLVINYDILYVQNKGSIVRDLSYNIYANIYTGNDITTISSHLFYGYTLERWAWQEAPHKIVWVVRNDGILLSLTFLKEQEVMGWAHHETNGDYKSICTISEGNEDAVYVVVQRNINGTVVQYIERFASRNMDGDIENGWFLDCAVQGTFGAPVSTVSGLDHLNGMTVGILGDGVALTNQVVVNGSVALSTPSSKVLVGLKYISKLQTLRIDVGEPTIQGKRKDIKALTTRVADSYGFKVGATFDILKAWNPNVQNFTGTSDNGLYTGDYRRNIGNGWTEDGQTCFQQDLPYPLTILGVIPEIVVGDTK